MDFKQSRNCFEFNDYAIDNHVSDIIAKEESIFIPNLNRNLRRNIVSGLLQSMTQSIFIDLFKVSYAKIKDADPADRIYQSDDCGWTGQIGYDQENAWGASIYTADEDVDIDAAGFYALGKDTKYQIYIAVGADGPNGFAGRTRVADGAVSDSGFYTMTFDTPVSVKKGQSFAVILYISTPGDIHPLAIEMPASSIEEGDVDITDGESYSSNNGLVWDSIEEGAGGNLCLKAYGRVASDDTDAKKD